METYTVEDGATELFFMFDFAGRPKYMSNPSPKNTRATPNHCLPCSGLLKISTEPRMVKNFLVVVKMEHVRGPKLLMVVNMKFCPMALAIPNTKMLNSTVGCLCTNPTASTPSPVTTKPMAR